MELNNKQIHEALNYCEKEVNSGRIWVCLRFEDYCWQHFMPNASSEAIELGLKWFSEKVQEFLHQEWIERHHCNSSEQLDAETTVWGPEGSQTNFRVQEVKELRLHMIAWLREQYPLES